MKKSILALAIAAASTAPFAAQAEGPIDGKIYGKVNVSLVNADEGSTDQWELDSNASRLGFEGATKINDGLSVIYKLEYEVSVDGDGDTFGKRNIIAGLQGNFGTVWAGRHDTPTKLAQEKIDLFNDLQGDLKNTFEGENRVNNIVAYTTPTMSGFAAMVAFVPGENDNGKAIGETDTTNDGLADGISYLVSYTVDNLYLAVAGDQDIDNQDLIRAVAQWQLDALQLGVMYQQNENNTDSDLKDESGYFVSAAYTIDAVTLKAQYGMLEDDAQFADQEEEETWSVGADYKLAKSTKLFAFYTANEDLAGVKAASDKDYVGVGLEHKF